MIFRGRKYPENLITLTKSIPHACILEAIGGKHNNGIQKTVNKTY